MRNIYIAGDSFSWFYNGKVRWPLWTDQIGQHFDANIINASLNGCSQDWQWQQIKNFVEQGMSTDDQLIVVLTNPMRFWFIEDQPQVSNAARATNLDHVVANSDLRISIKKFLANIWRPELALQHQRQRLSELSYWVKERQLNLPLIIPAFMTPIDPAEWPYLKIANGNLYDDLQLKEFSNTDHQDILDLWKGRECRYNHLCKQNHRVLAEAVINCLESNSQLDLSTLAIKTELITEENSRDPDFADRELDVDEFRIMIEETQTVLERVSSRVTEMFSPSNDRKKIIVAGGGTSGMITALTIKKLYPQYHVTVIESEKIGIVGVGEGSTEHWRWFMDIMGITTEQLIQQTGATFKFGVNFLDWRGPGHRFMHVVSEAFSVDTSSGREMIYSWLLAQGAGAMNIIPKHCAENLHRWPFTDTQQFHFDTFRLNEFLHDQAREIGIELIVQDIESVDSRDDLVKALRTSDQRILTADYYIDCTGFQRLIAKKALGSGWVSYQEWLPVDRAIAWPWPEHDDDMASWTLAQAMNAGWRWQTPVQGRTGNGYVFSSEFIDSDQAIKEVEQTTGYSIEKVARDIPFHAGRLDRPLSKNSAAVGISSGFIEPLEASSIAMTIQQTRWICENLDQLIAGDTHVVEKGNQHWQQLQENALDFISLHYQTDRQDTEFWRQVQKIEPSPGLKMLRERKFKHRLPHRQDFTNRDCLFREHNWLVVMAGLGLLTKQQAQKTLELQGPEFLERARERINLLKDLDDREPRYSHRQAIEYFLRDSP